MELSQLAASWIDDEQLANRIMKFSVAFAYTVKQCLRREHLNSDDLVGLVSPIEVSASPTLPRALWMMMRLLSERALWGRLPRRLLARKGCVRRVMGRVV